MGESHESEEGRRWGCPFNTTISVRVANDFFICAMSLASNENASCDSDPTPAKQARVSELFNSAPCMNSESCDRASPALQSSTAANAPTTPARSRRRAGVEKVEEEEEEDPSPGPLPLKRATPRVEEKRGEGGGGGGVEAGASKRVRDAWWLSA